MQAHTTAIVLAAGQGKRMQAKVHKQYLLIEDKPVLYYSLRAMEDSFMEDIVLVVGKGEEEYCRQEIIEKYHFTKVRAVVSGCTRSAGSVIMYSFMMVPDPLLTMRYCKEHMTV